MSLRAGHIVTMLAASVCVVLFPAAAVATTVPPANPIGPVTVLASPAVDTDLKVNTEIIDKGEVLTDSDRATLQEETDKIDFPDSVNRVVYVTFKTNDENLNDTVRSFGEDERHDLLDADQHKFAQGTIIVAVGLDPHGMGVYAGDNVAADVDLQDKDRLKAITDEMRPALKEENWALGLLEGARGVADPDLRVDHSGETATVLGLGGTFVAVGAAATGLGIRSARRKRTKQAREDYAYILAHHGDIATRLDAIDIRAHSLSSPLADDEFRRQWDNIKAAFLRAQASLGEAGGLSKNSPDKDFRKQQSSLASAKESVEEAVNAENNIEQLAALEHGDTTTRRRAMSALHRDVISAQSSAKGATARQLSQLDERILALRSAPDDPSFMDSYTEILSDYDAILDEVKDSLYAGGGTKRGTHTAPTLGADNWRPGMGNFYVPFVLINSWHSSDVAAAQSASSNSSGGVTTGYSAGGFSGAGGSSSF